MELYPSWLRKIWKEWDLRLMVLLSLTFQILLNFLGHRRKYSNKLWVRVVVWFAYIAADSVATFALGILSSNLIELYDKDPDVDGSSSSLDANTQLSAFWAPFLVLHLGGPDTITAYALEDNELWLRHLIGLVVQTGMALSVFLMSWTASSLSILSLVMFLPGIIKYGERTWVLRSTSSQKRRETNIFNYLLFFFKATFRQPVGFKSEEAILSSIDDILFISSHAFLDDTMAQIVRRYTFNAFLDTSPEYGFKVIEIELGKMYDMLYTKAPLSTYGFKSGNLHILWSFVLRLISFVLTCSVLVLFPVLVDQHKYSKVDVSITYLLIIAAVVHDIYAGLFKGSCSSKKRWSNNMSQYTLVSFTANKAKTEMQTSKFLDTTRVMGNYWHCEVSDDLRERIYIYVREKAEDAETSRKNIQKRVEGNEWRLPFTELPSTIGIGEKTLTISDPSLPHKGIKINEDLEGSIIIWHIATEVWYYSDRNDFKQNDFRLKCKMIKRVSRYMMYLLVERPSMLSGSVVNSTDPIKITSIRNMVEGRVLTRSRDRFDNKFKAEACKGLIEMSHDYSGNDKNKNLIYYAMKLVNEVNDKSQPLESKWKVIKNQWMDLFGYAARKCKGNEHAQQLRRGGELLTHVWLLLCHFGLTDHYEIQPEEQW